jgi:hypothetical protein
MSLRDTFTQIYQIGAWNDNNSSIPLSGPGSTIENTEQFRCLLDSFCESHDISSIVDIGCGDLTWMPLTNVFKTKKYTGIDIVPFLIEQHQSKYPQHTFFCKNVVEEDIPASDIIIIRDVLFHLKIEDIHTILKKLKCKYAFITSCRNTINADTFDKYHFHQINLRVAPFNMTNQIAQIYEPIFNRDICIYQFLSQ